MSGLVPAAVTPTITEVSAIRSEVSVVSPTITGASAESGMVLPVVPPTIMEASVVSSLVPPVVPPTIMKASVVSGMGSPVMPLTLAQVAQAVSPRTLHKLKKAARKAAKKNNQVWISSHLLTFVVLLLRTALFLGCRLELVRIPHQRKRKMFCVYKKKVF